MEQIILEYKDKTGNSIAIEMFDFASNSPYGNTLKVVCGVQEKIRSVIIAAK